MKKRLLELVPWAITVVALYFAFRGISWDMLLSELKSVSVVSIGAAVALTCASYLARAYRWQYFFEERNVLPFATALKVLILGFFMNNILPARAGELVRAHVGARMINRKRTLVLATIASERLVDGLTISLIFVCFGLGLARSGTSSKLVYVAAAFGIATLAVLLTLAIRTPLFALIDRIGERFQLRAYHYAVNRLQLFINSLSPLAKISHLPIIMAWSIAIWSIELGVYVAISLAFNVPLGLPQCVLFMVAVNFSSLIPSAPAGAGVIEAIASFVLMSLDIVGPTGEIPHLAKHPAIAMVLTQHVIQFLVVGIPGVAAALLIKKQIGALRDIKDEGE